METLDDDVKGIVNEIEDDLEDEFDVVEMWN